MQVYLENNRHLSQFLKSQKLTHANFLNQIIVRYHDVVQCHPEKIKTVAGARHDGRLLFEFKLPYDRSRTFRIAYVQGEGTLTVVYASKTVLKKEFVKELNKTSLVD